MSPWVPAGLARWLSTSQHIQPVTGSVRLWPGCDQCQHPGLISSLIRPAACQETSERRLCVRRSLLLPHPALFFCFSLSLFVLMVTFNDEPVAERDQYLTAGSLRAGKTKQLILNKRQSCKISDFR